jgi:hypothetical protein
MKKIIVAVLGLCFLFSLTGSALAANHVKGHGKKLAKKDKSHQHIGKMVPGTTILK